MIIITLEVPDRVINGVCGRHGYENEVLDMRAGQSVPNPESKEKFVKNAIIRFLKNSAIDYEKKLVKIGVDSKIIEEIEAAGTRGQID